MYSASIFGSEGISKGLHYEDTYQAIADYPNKMSAAVGKAFASLNPNQQDVADAVVNLISLPKGQRPKRTHVDPFTGMPFNWNMIKL